MSDNMTDREQRAFEMYARALELLAFLVQEIELSEYADGHGRKLTMNKAYRDAHSYLTEGN